MDDAVLAVVADLHVGSRAGLCPPEAELDSGGKYAANSVQQALWQGWCEFWGKDVPEARGNSPLVVLALGDLVERLGTPTSWANSLSEQIAAARQAMEEARSLCGGWDALYVLRGTAWHVGEGGGAEEEIARMLGAEPGPDGRYSRYRLLLDFGDALVDAAHAAWGAYRQWTRGGNASRLAAEVLAVCAEEGWRVPDLVVRAHTHNVADSGATFRNCRAITCPAFTATTDYAYGRGNVRPADIGALLGHPRDIRVIRKLVVERGAEAWLSTGKKS